MIRMSSMKPCFRPISRLLSKATCLVLVATSVIAATPAQAVSARVKLACANDYLAHCRQHPPSSPAARACMRGVGENLSPKCVKALVADGEVSAKEVAE